MKIGIISSQKNPPDPLNWMRFHVDVGIDNFFITIEDTPHLGPMLTEYANKLGTQKKRPIHVYYENADAIDRTKEDNYTDLQTRQQTRVNHMLEVAKKNGVDWVFHIDDDELLYPGSKEAISTWPKVLKDVPKSCASIHLQNWEGFSPQSPASSWITDPGVRYLPQACGSFFAAYGNGKSASRTVEGQSAHGPHHFRGGKECELSEKKGVVLHHEALAMGSNDVPPTRWIEKNKLRLNDDLTKIPFIATHDAINAVRSGDAARMEETWKKYRSVSGERYQKCTVPVSLTLPSHSY